MRVQGSRRIVGIALLVSAVALALLAVLVFTGVLGIAEDGRVLLGGALLAAAVLDAFVAATFVRPPA
jgi:hypothetical protein